MANPASTIKTTIVRFPGGNNDQKDIYRNAFWASPGGKDDATDFFLIHWEVEEKIYDSNEKAYHTMEVKGYRSLLYSRKGHSMDYVSRRFPQPENSDKDLLAMIEAKRNRFFEEKLNVNALQIIENERCKEEQHPSVQLE